MVNLNTQTVVTTFNSPPTTYGTSGPFQVNIPQSSVMVCKPVTYEFRVVEHIKDGQIVKVGLQYQVWEHDNYGTGAVRLHWTDVPRVQKDVDTGAIISV